MAGTSPATTTNIAARGVLERHCAIGKTPLLAACLCNRSRACQNARAAGESRESPRAFIALRASRAPDPHRVAGAYHRSRHRPLRLFAGAAGHARRTWLVVFGRGVHEHHQCRRLSRRRPDGVETSETIRIVRRGARGNAGLHRVAGAVRHVRQFHRSKLCAAARGAGRGGRIRRRRCASGEDCAIAALAGEFSAEPVLRRTRARHLVVGPDRALRAAGFRAGIVVDRLVDADAALDPHDDSAVAGTDWYWCRDSRCGANQIRDRAGVDLPRRLFSVRCRIHRIYDFHDRVYPRCRRRCGGAERVLVPDRPKCVRDAVGVEPVAGAQQWRRQHRDHSRCQRGRRGVAAVGAFHRVACHIGDGVRRRVLRGGGIDHRLRALQLSPRGMAHGNCGVDDLVWNWPDARADRGRRRHRRHGKPVICPQRLGGDAGGGCDCRGISETAAYKYSS